MEQGMGENEGSSSAGCGLPCNQGWRPTFGFAICKSGPYGLIMDQCLMKRKHRKQNSDCGQIFEEFVHKGKQQKGSATWQEVDSGFIFWHVCVVWWCDEQHTCHQLGIIQCRENCDPDFPLMCVFFISSFLPVSPTSYFLIKPSCSCIVLNHYDINSFVVLF